MAIVGSIRSLKINSEDIPVVSESELKAKPGYETEAKSTTGGALISVEKMIEVVEGVSVDASDTTIIDTLKGIVTTGVLVPISFEMQGGQIFTVAAGTIGMGDYSTKTGIQEITLIPSSDWIRS